MNPRNIAEATFGAYERILEVRDFSGSSRTTERPEKPPASDTIPDTNATSEDRIAGRPSLLKRFFHRKCNSHCITDGPTRTSMLSPNQTPPTMSTQPPYRASHSRSSSVAVRLVKPTKIDAAISTTKRKTGTDIER